jgi:RNA polymerase sigma factor (sigma-70 family)
MARLDNMTPFAKLYDHMDDELLVRQAQQGSRQALEALIKKHQHFLYNVARTLLKDSDEAADLTQEVLIKMITRLSQFRNESSFTTWLYRIMMNHFLTAEKRSARNISTTFSELGDFISGRYNDDDFTTIEKEQFRADIDELRNQCMKSMLMCLDKQQRCVFTLGAIFNLKSTVAANILGVSPANFRQQLSRAKEDLFQFMNNKCGLIDPNNPCRCSKKTKGLMHEGKLDPRSKKFALEFHRSIDSVVKLNNRKLDELMEGRYLSLFRSIPYEEYDRGEQLVNNILLDPDVKSIFQLN